MDKSGKGTDEEDAIKIFELTEENGDEGIALYVVYIPLLKENIGFVEEKYCFPGDGVLEDFFELDLQGLRFRT